MGHLTRFRGNSVPGGRQEVLPATLSRGFRARWEARKATWNAFAGIPCQVGGKRCHLERFRGDSVAGGQQEVLPATLLRGFRARWEAGRCHLERFRGDSVPGEKQGDATCHAFTGIPCQVGDKKCYLEHFRGNTVAGGQQERTPGTLLQGFRARWAARDATWNAFAGIPWQVGSRKGHLERFCGKTVAGGRQEMPLGTLSREFRGRWAAGKDT